MKKNAFSLCLAGTVLFGTVTTPALALSVDKLTDVSKNDWFYPYVQYVAEKEYMVGVAENTFAPNMQVTRAMFVTTLAALDGAAVSTAQTPFTDVSADAWYANAVKWAYANGIVAGISPTEFGPNAVISREQMCVMMSAFLRYRADKDNKLYKTTQEEKAFPDALSISSWAQSAVKNCQMWGLVAGDENGYMNPQKAATRAEAAVVLKQLDAILAAGVDAGTPSGGGSSSGGGSVGASYSVKMTINAPNLSRSGLELTAYYNGVKASNDKKLSVVAQDLISGANVNKINNAVKQAIQKATNNGAGRTKTVTMDGQKATITIDGNGKVSATVEVKVTDLLGDNGGASTLTLLPEDVTVEQMQELLERLQASNGSYVVKEDDGAVIEALVNKATDLAAKDPGYLEDQKQQLIDKNPSLEQALSGMTGKQIKEALVEYQGTLEEVKTTIQNTQVGETAPVPVESTTMTVALDLREYMSDVMGNYDSNRASVISRVEGRLGVALDSDEEEKLLALYDLAKPEDYVKDNGDGTFSLKERSDYVQKVNDYVLATCEFYESLGDRSEEAYLELLNSVEDAYGSDYGVAFANKEDFADLMADEDGIFVDENGDYREATMGVTVTADNDAYQSWVNLITGRFDQAQSVLPIDIPAQLIGSYSVTLVIDKL